jgi:arsenate reductase
VTLDKHDLAKDAPTRAQLEAWITEKNLDAALNKRSPKYKELGLSERRLTKREAIDLMMSDVNLLRRPVVIKGRSVVFGYDEAAYDEVTRP